MLISVMRFEGWKLAGRMQTGKLGKMAMCSLRVCQVDSSERDSSSEAGGGKTWQSGKATCYFGLRQEADVSQGSAQVRLAHLADFRDSRNSHPPDMADADDARCGALIL